MIYKILIGFLTSDSNANLGVNVDVITSAMTGNAYYPELDSGIAEVVALNTAFKEATVAAAGGGVTLTADRNTKREALVMRVRDLAAYVQAYGKNDMGILLSSGFSLQKTTRAPSTILPAPTVQSIGAGRNSGTAAMKLVSLGAPVYNWRFYPASTPDLITMLPQTTAANRVFADLIPGEKYFFQGNAVNSAGTSNWSAAMPLIVT